jgi:ribosome biogenesis ATPase
MDDFVTAAKTVLPTAKREGFAVVPDVTWTDVGALAEVRDELTHNVLDPIAHPERFRSLGLEVPAGVLFFGPPGCGKTLLAKALANQSGANFISVKGPELLNMYVGESESRVRQVFSRARSSAPCVIFFDELDALCPKRGSGADAGGGNNVSDRVVNQLLTELDGLEVRKDVYIIGATNRLELIDDAMLRPGRLGKLLYVPLPSREDRVSILQALARKVSLYNDVDLESIAKDSRTDGFSGADLAALVREAGLAVVKEWKVSGNEAGDVDDIIPKIFARHFETALSKVQPSVSAQDRERYQKVHELIRAGVAPIQALRTSRLGQHD